MSKNQQSYWDNQTQRNGYCNSFLEAAKTAQWLNMLKFSLKKTNLRKIDNVLEIAEDMLVDFEHFNKNIIKKYAVDLADFAKSFSVEEIINALSYFDALIEKLEFFLIKK